MRILISATLIALLAGCATAPQTASRPALYPNSVYNRMGQAAAEAEVSACMDKARAAGLNPNAESGAAAHSAAAGGVMGGVAGVIGGLVTGRGLEDALKQGVASAAVGGATGAAGGAMRPNQTNPLYRNFVQRCISERGLESIGWN